MNRDEILALSDNEIVAGPVFGKLRETDKKIIVCQGGGDAGKTTDILKYFALSAIENKGEINSVVAETVPDIKKGALRIFQKYIANHPKIKPHILRYNIADRIYYFRNGSIIEFISFEDDLSARGGERDNLFINEANKKNITYRLFWEAKRKTRKKVIIDFNPTAAFWAHDVVLNKANTEYVGQTLHIITDHRHNVFLDQETHDFYENIADPETKKVYSRGQLGVLKGQVYVWQPIEALPTCNSVLFGIDYGYTNDPTAIVKITYNKVGEIVDRFYVQELAYTAGLSPVDIRNILDNHGHKSGMLVFTEHDVDINLQLRGLGIAATNAYKTDLDNRILWMKKQNIYYHANSLNIKNEVSKCVWIENKNATSEEDRYTNKRIDAFDHLLNATEYGMYSAFMFHRL